MIDSRAMILAASLALGACERGDDAQRRLLLESPAVERLVGSWRIEFTADARSLVSTRHARDTIAGNVAFTIDHHGPRSVTGLQGVTHQGSYDLDFTPFGWRTQPSNAPGVALARVVPGGDRRASAPVADSLYVVLSPDASDIPVELAGVLTAAGARGTWSAGRFSAGGGSGRFIMRR